MKFNFKRPGRTAIIAAVLAVTVLSVGAMAAGPFISRLPIFKGGSSFALC